MYPHGPRSFPEMGLAGLPLGAAFLLRVHGRRVLVPGCRVPARGMRDAAAVGRLALFPDTCAGVLRGRVGPLGPRGCVCATVRQTAERPPRMRALPPASGRRAFAGLVVVKRHLIEASVCISPS